MKNLFMVLFVIVFFSPHDFRKGFNNKRNTRFNRLIGGNPTTINEFPCMVGVINQKQNSLICGGAIIGKYWVLTAAHCILDTKKDKDGVLEPKDAYKENHVIIRGNTSYSDDSDPHRHEHKVISYFYHKQFRKWESGFIDNDIGLLKVSEAFDAAFEKEISIDAPSSMYAGGTSVLSPGWGRIQFDPQQYSKKILYLQRYIMGHRRCSNHLSIRDVSSRGKICVFSKRSSVCKGDSGGPLIQGNFHVGVVSLVGRTGCIPGFADYYSKTSYYGNWIRNHMQNGDSKSFDVS